MVRYPIHDKYDDREEKRTQQEAEDHFVFHLICFESRILKKPDRRSAQEK